jgi:hypothetical protein
MEIDGKSINLKLYDVPGGSETPAEDFKEMQYIQGVAIV